MQLRMSPGAGISYSRRIRPVLPPSPSPLAQSPAEQARQRRIREAQAELDVIDHQLSVSNAEEARLTSVIAEYQRKVETVPKRESELVELTRDYDVLKKTYDSLLSKREESQLAANLERRQIGEQFKLLDTASMPERPFNEMQRLGIMSSGAIAGLVIGLLIVAARELLDTSVRSEQEAHAFSVPVLSARARGSCVPAICLSPKPTRALPEHLGAFEEQTFEDPASMSTRTAASPK